MCNGTVNIFIKHCISNFNINKKIHCWDLKVSIVAETPSNNQHMFEFKVKNIEGRVGNFRKLAIAS